MRVVTWRKFGWNAARARAGGVALALAACALGEGCVSSQTAKGPPDLAQARDAYARVAKGSASKVAPADLHEARAALDEAQETYKKEGASPRARTQAYVATRRAEIAEAVADERVAREQKANAAEAALRAQLAPPAPTQPPPPASSPQASPPPSAQASRPAPASGPAGVAEVQPREPAPTPTAPEKEILVPGSEIFAPGAANLLPSAAAALDSTAEALRAIPGVPIEVQAYSEPSPDEIVSHRLATLRAEAVRSYLAWRGVDPTRLEIAGHTPQDACSENAGAGGGHSVAGREVRVIVVPPTGGPN